MPVSKEDLIKARFGIEEVDVPGVGTIKVRALSRSEALKVRNKELPVAEVERILLSCAMVEPKMSEEDIRAWQDASPAGELQPIMKAITRLSGMEEDAPKSGVSDA